MAGLTTKRLPFDFTSQTYELADARSLSCQRLVNWYPEAVTVSEKAPKQYALMPAEGLKSVGDLLSGGPWRGLLSMGGVLYGVVGSSFVSILVDALGIVTTTTLGTIGSPSGPLSMTASSDTVIMVDGVNGYGYTVAGGFNQITDPDFMPASWVTYQDGYFIFGENNNEGTWFISNLLDGFNYDALDFASAEASPDPLIYGISDHREIWLFGTRTIEVWWNSGNADFPFERINGAYIERGCGAAGSVSKLANSLYWLGDDGVVYRAEDYVPQRISSHAIERVIATVADFSDAVGFAFTQGGHKFYGLTLPALDRTFFFDVATGLWHERGEWDSLNSTYKRFPASVVFQDGATVYVGHWNSYKLFKMDTSEGEYDGESIRYEMTFPPLQINQDHFVISRMQIDFQSGKSLEGEDDQAMLQWSNDSGLTWSNEHWASMGRIGEYDHRVFWRRLGAAQKGRVFKCAVNCATKPVVMGAYIDVWID